ncbi:efflux RND transporter permease subunit [Enterobacter hormaechei]
MGNILRSTGRYLLLYIIIVVAMAFLFVRLPSSFLPDEDQGVFLSMAQLPAGATQERTQKVLDEMTDYFLTKRKTTSNPCLRLTALASRVVVRTPVSPSFL